MGKSESFQYGETLAPRTIRLVQVHPIGPDERLSVRLGRIKLDKPHLKFTALSYVWGDPNGVRPITCNGSRIDITYNLYDALWQLRSNDLRGYIWIDALCINQKNLQEKTDQVRMMRTIYSSAKMVLIWLGKESPTDRDGYEMIKKLTSEALKPHVRMMPNGNVEMDEEAFQQLDVTLASSKRWKALGAIYLKNWFRRIWVVQEYVCSREAIFLSGNLEMASEPILEAARIIQGTAQLNSLIGFYLDQGFEQETPFRTASILHGMQKNLRTTRDMGPIEILYLCQGLKASDSRDLLFAPVSLTTEVSNDFIDYEKPMDKLLVDMSVLCLLENRIRPVEPLSFLSMVRRSRIWQTPSWVHDWATEHKGLPLVGYQYVECSRLNMSDRVAPFTQVDSNLSLRVRGKIIDSVQAILPYNPVPTSSYSDSKFEGLLSDIVVTHAWLLQVQALIAQVGISPTGLSLSEVEARALSFQLSSVDGAGEKSRLASFEQWKTLLYRRIRCNDSILPAQRLKTSQDLAKLLICTGFLYYGGMNLFDDAHLRTILCGQIVLQGTAIFLQQVARLAAVLGSPALSCVIITGSWILGTRITWRLVTWQMLWLLSDLASREMLFWVAKGYYPRIMRDVSGFHKESSRIGILAEEFERRLGLYTGRLFCLSQNRYVGWVPSEAKVGDKIACLVNTKMLFVFRETDGAYELIGDCYLQGIMDGEPIKAHKSELEEIRIE